MLYINSNLAVPDTPCHTLVMMYEDLSPSPCPCPPRGRAGEQTRGLQRADDIDWDVKKAGLDLRVQLLSTKLQLLVEVQSPDFSPPAPPSTATATTHTATTVTIYYLYQLLRPLRPLCFTTHSSSCFPIQSVQSERLSLDEYLDRIRARLARDEVLLRYLTNQQQQQQQVHAQTDEMDDADGGRSSELAENVDAVHRRIEIMRTEIQNAVAADDN